MTTKVYRCKSHDYRHEYTVCPQCACQYCPKTWPQCPRVSWHPAHGTDDADRGRRYTALEDARRARPGIGS